MHVPGAHRAAIAREIFADAPEQGRTGVDDGAHHQADDSGRSEPGATTREIMARLGHRSRAAADRYQHAAARRDAELAERLNTVAEAARSRRSRDIG